MTITFGERPDPKLSTIKVLDTSGKVVSTGPSTAVSGDPLKLTVPLQLLPSGVYTVAWRTVSAVDGHLATGSFAFGVGTAPPTAAAGTTAGSGATPASGGSSTGSVSGPSTAAILGRWFLFVGLIALLGSAVFGLVVATPAVIVGRRLLPIAWLLASVGTLVVVGVQLADAGVAPSEVVGTSFGVAILERTVPLLMAGIGVVAIAMRGLHRTWLAVVATGAALCLLADVLLSHAAAGDVAVVEITVQAVHVIAVGLWLGGLAGLLLTVGRTADDRTAEAARRFSWLATIGIATVAVTGLLRAITEVGSVDALLTTDFGHLVIAKTALLGVLGVLGAINHFGNVPAAGRTVRGLRRVGSTELLVGGTVILLSATLVNLAPPAEVAAATGVPSASASPSPVPSLPPLTAEGNDFGTSVRLRLDVSPGTAGFNTFTANLSDYDSGAPVAAGGLALRFVLPAKPDVGSSRLDLVPTGTGTFSATGSNLSLDGTWRITATVADGSASVQIPLEVTTRPTGPVAASPSPTVDVNAEPGLPTIFTVHLSAGRTVQLYLDPGHAGANEVHATFFDASGNELPVPSATMAMAPSGDPLTPLVARTLEPGHFVADTTLVPGTYTLAVSGPAPGGGLLTTQIQIPVTK